MRLLRLALLVAIVPVCGCRNSERIGKPHLFGPGSADFQQHQAQRYDPYPDTLSGPAVVGGRPDSYSAPAPETVRGTPRNQTTRWGFFD